MLKQENDDVLKHNGIVILLPWGAHDFHYWFQSCYYNVSMKINKWMLIFFYRLITLIWYHND